MDLTFVTGDIVWAKLGGYPWWPASVKRVVSENLFEIEYFGEFERNFFDRSRLRAFGEPPEKINRRNSKLLESHAQALRVKQGVSTAELERYNYFSKKLDSASQKTQIRRSATQGDISLVEVMTQQAGAPDARDEPDVKVEPSLEQFVEERTDPGQGGFIKGQIKNSERSKGLHATKRAKKIQKPARKLEPLQMLRHVSLPAQALVKPASLSQFGNDNNFEEQSNESVSHRDPPQQVLSEPTPKEESSSMKIECVEALRLEAALRDILTALQKDRPQFLDVQKRFALWMEDFTKNEAHIDQMFQTEIGTLINKIVARCAVLGAKPQLRDLHSTSLEILTAIRGRLVSNFFKVENFGHPKLHFAITPQPFRILAHKKSVDLVENQPVNGCPQSSNCALSDLSNVQNSINTIETHGHGDCKENGAVKIVSDEDIFRVSRKLARLLFEKVVRGRKSRNLCEHAANSIEARIREVSKSRKEYQAKFVFLFHRLELDSERFLSKFKGFSQGAGDIPIMDVLQPLLN